MIKISGKVGEEIACLHYLKNGYQLILKNFQFYQKGQKGRIGEIDLIFIKESLLVFVEVKTRNSPKFGNIVGQISAKKVDTLYKTAEYFLYLLKTDYEKLEAKENNLIDELILKQDQLQIRFDLACIQNNELIVYEGFL